MQSPLFNIPAEMRLYKQWCVWRYEDTDGPKPTKVPYNPNTGKLCNVVDPSTWSTFDECLAALVNTKYYDGAGFILSENDPFAFIDLDDTKGDQIALERQIQLYNQFESYAERSPSGKGLHIIVKGAVPSGRRRNFIEIYSSERYMTVTGEVYRNAPVADYNETLNALWLQMGKSEQTNNVYLGLGEEKETDQEIFKKAALAANGDKFKALHEGNWQDLYPSQSEADFAYFDMIAFYTQNRAQIIRMFRASALGQREKAKRADYIGYMLNKCFDRMLPPVDIDGLNNQVTEAIAKSKKKKKLNGNYYQTILENPFSLPPGLLGRLAQFIYSAAPRPVPEIALAGALGLLSGIVGRSYNVSGTGINQYLLLLAPTGTGKEAIASGIDRLMGQVIKHVPAAQDFMGPAAIQSAPALTKYLQKYPSILSVVGEFAIHLKQLAAEFAPPHLLALKGMILDLYNKSGEGQTLRPMIYSDKEKNTAIIQSPSFTLLGESTPEKFYELLSENMIAEGLLPRFTIIEYAGKRPELNKSHKSVMPSFELIEQVSSLCAHSLNLNNQHKTIAVQLNKDAEEMLDGFENHATANINSSDRDVRKQLWNRAHLKALKISALVAIGNDPYSPTISSDISRWAINLILHDVRNMLSKFDAGEIGIDNNENRQLMRAIAGIREYAVKPWSEIQSFNVGNPLLHSEKIIPYSFIHKKLANSQEFKHDKQGATLAVKRTLKTLIERGDIQEIPRSVTMTKYKTHAVCYAIAIPRAFDL